MVAKELKAGDTLELANGRTIKLVKVEVAFHEQPVAVYNFEVADWHTYYVGEDSLLVHNAKPCPGGGNGVIPDPSDVVDSSPLKIPSTATVNPQAKNGYDQIKFKWNKGNFSYEARWHTPTPGSPPGTGNNWVVQRKTHGNSNGKQKAFHILTGKYKWTKKNVWMRAVFDYQDGIATSGQLKMLSNGHWPAP